MGAVRLAGASLYLLARWLRRVRGIELAASESEPTDKWNVEASKAGAQQHPVAVDDDGRGSCLYKLAYEVAAQLASRAN